jgi:hypothetical protein
MLPDDLGLLLPLPGPLYILLAGGDRLDYAVDLSLDLSLDRLPDGLLDLDLLLSLLLCSVTTTVLAISPCTLMMTVWVSSLVMF